MTSFSTRPLGRYVLIKSSRHPAFCFSLTRARRCADLSRASFESSRRPTADFRLRSLASEVRCPCCHGGDQLFLAGGEFDPVRGGAFDGGAPSLRILCIFDGGGAPRIEPASRLTSFGRYVARHASFSHPRLCDITDLSNSSTNISAKRSCVTSLAIHRYTLIPENPG